MESQPEALCARRAGMLVVTRGEACKCRCRQWTKKARSVCMSRIKDQDTRLTRVLDFRKKNIMHVYDESSQRSHCPALLSIEGSEQGLSLCP